MTIQVETACCHPVELHCNVLGAYDAHPELRALSEMGTP
jgi:hypothetical protein